MCGIGGYLAHDGSGVDPDVLARMTDALAHRGPDDRGQFVDSEAGIALGHRRLSIVDLSPLGHQPMTSESGRYVIVFNGEIYNFRGLAQTLGSLGHRFRGHSDTEVILAAIEAWGLESAVRRFVGIFAFAVWDRRARVLHLVRDHLGVKPLYYAHVDGALLFGSELKALAQHPRFHGTIDRGVLALLLRHNCIPSPYTIYREAVKLPPGTILSVRAGETDVEPRVYWSAREAAAAGLADPLDYTPDEATDALDTLLRDAVGLQMLADVPLGAFLSGGVDSSTVVALMQAQSRIPVKTFSIGFRQAGFDEAVHARAVAAHLGTDHTELYVSDEDVRTVIPMLPAIYDEPFADSSQIPTFLVSRLARTQVTVALSGDGGDELFAGYNRHVWGQRLWERLCMIPPPARRAAGHAIAAVPTRVWDRGGRVAAMLGVRATRLGNKVQKVAGLLAVDAPEHLYRRFLSQWSNPTEVVLGAHEPPTILTRRDAWLGSGTITEQMMYLDLVTYLPDNNLTKVDRASMAVGLEARVPLLDHRVVEFSWRLPLAHKLRDGEGKRVLRDVLYRYVPRELIERPKSGFTAPLQAWLRGPLREWAEDLLSPDRLRADGFFDPAPIQEAWREHLTGERSRHSQLWTVLAFQSWYHEGGR